MSAQARAKESGFEQEAHCIPSGLGFTSPLKVKDSGDSMDSYLKLIRVGELLAVGRSQVSKEPSYWLESKIGWGISPLCSMR